MRSPKSGHTAFSPPCRRHRVCASHCSRIEGAPMTVKGWNPLVLLPIAFFVVFIVWAAQRARRRPMPRASSAHSPPTQ